MTKKLLLLSMAALICLSAGAQIKINGVFQKMRTDDGDDSYTTSIGSVFEKDGQYTVNYMYGQPGWTYVGYLSIPNGGIQSITWNGTTVSSPVQTPAFTKATIVDGSNNVDWEKAQVATNLINMLGNSGSVKVGNNIITVFSRDEQSTVDEELFSVRKWDVKTAKQLSQEIRPKSDNLESAGMSYNCKDGKVYGLFYITDAQLSSEITSDPEYFTDQDDQDFDREGLDAGYCLCTIDLKTMKITPITPGLYYYNFVTFAINSEGRAFALTSGGTSAPEGADGKVRDINNNLTGAQLIEFDLKTGLMKRNSQKATDPDTGEEYTEYTFPYPATGYCSQYKRQAACFAKSNPNKMYWIGYYNSGKGYNNYGSWGTLPDKEWKTNGKFDTALYEIDLITGNCTRLGKIPNRMVFSAIWIDGDDCSDGSEIDINGIEEVESAAPQSNETKIFNLNGQVVKNQGRGLYIIKDGNKTRKVMTR